MDFVVVGFGLGALIVLIGIAVRDLAPRLRRSEVEEPTGDRLRELYSIKRVPAALWAVACHRAGQAIMLGGGAVILAAVGGIVAGLDNGDGAHLVLAVVLVAVGAIAMRVGTLANALFPIDRRSRERAWQLVQRAKPIPVTATAKSTPETAAPTEASVVPETAVPETAVAATATVVAADVAPNGASTEAIPADAEVKQAETQSATSKGDEGGERIAEAEEASAAADESPPPTADEPVVTAEEPAGEAVKGAEDLEVAKDEVEAKADDGEEAVEAADPAADDDQEEGADVGVEDTAPAAEDAPAVDDVPAAPASAKENEADRASKSSEVATSGQTTARA